MFCRSMRVVLFRGEFEKRFLLIEIVILVIRCGCVVVFFIDRNRVAGRDFSCCFFIRVVRSIIKE